MENKNYDSKQQIDKIPFAEQKNIELATQLNNVFKKGDLLDQHKEILHNIDKPILVDFNNVLVNNCSELKPNPHAKEFIAELEQLGQVIVVTTASNWDLVHSELVKFDLWTDKMILITKKNFYIDYFQDDLDTADYYGINQKDLALLKQRVTSSAPAHKRIGEIFNKEFDIPLIDDTGMATEDNPHIHGIHVEPWFTEKEYPFEEYEYTKSLIEKGNGDEDDKEELTTFELGLSGETLKRAVDEVRKIYK